MVVEYAYGLALEMNAIFVGNAFPIATGEVVLEGLPPPIVKLIIVRPLGLIRLNRVVRDVVTDTLVLAIMLIAVWVIGGSLAIEILPAAV